ncbi:MAG: CapA family protein [Clostridia bacterium]|nr:CapA family protein [Clostridia bacterium]
MSNKPVKGLRVGNYRITPLGLIVLAVLVMLIIAAVVLVVVRPFGNTDDVAATNVLPPEVEEEAPEAEVTEAPTPTPEPEPTPTPEPELRSATIRSLGEIAMQQNLLRAAVNGNTFDFSNMFTNISLVIGNADYTVADVEGSLGGTTEYSGSNKMITPPALIGTLKECGVDMLMLANDHALDGGFNDLQATIQNCQEEDMDYVGAAASAEERATPLIREIGGINVAFLAYTESLNGNEQAADPAALEYGVNLISKSNAKKDIDSAREAGADVIVCYCSWGEMFNPAPTDTEKKIAQKLAEWGVDVIIGYNPHVVQPATWLETKDAEGNVRRTLCLGATGNLLSDQYGKNDNGIVFQFTIEETEHGKFAITNPVYVPTYVWRSETEDGKYNYQALAVGQWLEDAPEGMAYADAARMRQVWADLQSVMGADVATVAAE